MPKTETNSRTRRYREHRQALTRFSRNQTLTPKYAFFAELILLWLDSDPSVEDEIWTLIMYFISNAKPPKTRFKEDYEQRDETNPSDPVRDEWTKEKIKEGLSVFLASEED